MMCNQNKNSTWLIGGSYGFARCAQFLLATKTGGATAIQKLWVKWIVGSWGPVATSIVLVPSVKRLKLLVLLSVYSSHKLSVSIKINHLVHFGLITVDTNSLDSFVRSHYPFWILHNFVSDFFLWCPMKMTSNETSFTLLKSIIAEYVDAYKVRSTIFFRVLEFRI